jgi:hypothetical protein
MGGKRSPFRFCNTDGKLILAFQYFVSYGIQTKSKRLLGSIKSALSVLKENRKRYQTNICLSNVPLILTSNSLLIGSPAAK